MLRIAAVLSVLLLAAACGGGDAEGTAPAGDGGDSPDVPTTPIVFETLEKGAQGPADTGTVVARTQQEFDDAWRAAGGDEPPALSGVDFATQMVIAVFQGQQSTAGYDIEITDIGPEYVVTYEVTQPADGCITAQVLTAPFHVVSVPASPKRPSFDPVEQTNPC